MSDYQENKNHLDGLMCLLLLYNNNLILMLNILISDNLISRAMLIPGKEYVCESSGIPLLNRIFQY